VFVRVVRFTDVTTEQIEAVASRIGERDAPPEGAPAMRVQVLHDESAGTALAVQYFESMEDMRKGDEVFGAMDSADTPGTRVSVDMCELKLERALG
jgi:hypothetical protein